MTTYDRLKTSPDDLEAVADAEREQDRRGDVAATLRGMSTDLQRMARSVEDDIMGGMTLEAFLSYCWQSLGDEWGRMERATGVTGKGTR